MNDEEGMYTDKTCRYFRSLQKVATVHDAFRNKTEKLNRFRRKYFFFKDDF